MLATEGSAPNVKPAEKQVIAQMRMKNMDDLSPGV